MAESIVQVTEGSGKKLHTFQRTIGANNVEDEIVLMGDQYLASYHITPGAAISIATANDHILQIMAGTTLNVYLRRLRVYQAAVATTVGFVRWQLWRLSTAGTGGTATTPAPLDSTDAASGATSMRLPTVKGTETTLLDEATSIAMQTLGTGNAGLSSLMLDWDWEKLPRVKMPRIAAGTANGLALKSITATAACTVVVVADITEANF